MKVLVFFCFIALLSPFIWAEDDITNFQKIVVLKSAAFMAPLTDYVKKQQIPIVAKGKKFFSVRPSKSITRSDYQKFLGKLKMQQGVLRIDNDVLWESQNSLQDIIGPCLSCQSDAARDDALVEFSKMLDSTNKTYCNDRDCRISPEPCDGMNPAWARMSVGADLADKIVEEELLKAKARAGGGLKLEDYAANVAVLDTGFDTQQQITGMDVLSLEAYAGFDLSGDHNIDEQGHGTSVAGMIGGADIGISKYVNLDVYRITESGRKKKTPISVIGEAIEKACENNDVVNVSWGDLAREYGIQDVKEEIWYDVAAEKGCLIVRASGNTGIRTDNQSNVEITDPLISVGAVGQFQTEAAFSTSGMIYGPGDKTYSLLSSQVPYIENDPNDRSCVRENGQRIGPVSGTSFAAPAVSGIAGQIITVLKARGVLPADPKEKVVLVKSILLASSRVPQTGGRRQINTVNALAAVVIAKAVTADMKNYDLASLEQAASNMTEEICGRPDRDCRYESDCEKRKEFINDLRFKAQMCKTPYSGLQWNDPYGEEQHKRYQAYKKRMNLLHSSLQCFQEEQLIFSLVGEVGSGVLEENYLSERFFENSWQQNTRRETVYDLSLALDIMHSAQKMEQHDFITLDKIEGTIKSPFFVRLERSAGTMTSRNDFQYSRFLSLFRQLPERDQLKILAQLPYLRSRFSISMGELGLLHLLDENRSGFSESFQRKLDRKISDVAGEWLKNGLFEKSDDPEFDKQVPTEIVDMLISKRFKGKERLLKALKKPVSLENMHLFTYILETDNDELFTKEEKRSVANKVLAENLENRDLVSLFALGKAGNAAILNAESKEDLAVLKRFLIENPRAEIPDVAILEHRVLEQPYNKLFGDDQQFWNEFVEVNIARLTVEIARGKGNFRQKIIQQQNIFDSVNDNVYVDSSQAFERHKREFLRLVDTASSAIIKDSSASSAQSVIAEFIDSRDAFQASDFDEELKKLLLPLKDAIAKNPDDYPSSFAEKIVELYSL